MYYEYRAVVRVAGGAKRVSNHRKRAPRGEERVGSYERRTRQADDIRNFTKT